MQEKERSEYLPKLEEFLKMDNERNWRFRLELADQLGALVTLFPPEDVKAYLAPLALSLVQDRVAAVRSAATLVVSNMILARDPSLNSYLFSELQDKVTYNCAEALFRCASILTSTALLSCLLYVVMGPISSVSTAAMSRAQRAVSFSFVNLFLEHS